MASQFRSCPGVLKTGNDRPKFASDGASSFRSFR
jgi:hypothetical protein